ncbi:MAG: hypothetical protein OEY58_19780 [Gammaproteobacteria bacterium]|nr:hypothetical protein [Gammaproteobacteria bacterium]
MSILLVLTGCFTLPILQFGEPSVYSNGIRILTPDEVMYAYESRVDKPMAYTSFAYYLSKEYRRSRNEFRRHDILGQIIPVVDARLDEAASRKEYVLRFERDIGEYHFRTGAFHTGFARVGYLHYTANYGIYFVNGKEWDMFSMPEDRARDIIRRGTRTVQWEARVRVTSVGRDKLSYGPLSFLANNRKVVNVAIKDLKVYW